MEWGLRMVEKRDPIPRFRDEAPFCLTADGCFKLLLIKDTITPDQNPFDKKYPLVFPVNEQMISFQHPVEPVSHVQRLRAARSFLS